MLEIRQARVSDHRTIVECVQRWWVASRTPDQARELSLLLPKLFLQFFSNTSLVLEDGTGIKAFVVGFYAADNEDEAYIHFVGVDPKLRGQGTARKLYTGSVAFHRAMGFTLEEGDREFDGLPIHSDYDGPGQDRVCFRRRIAP
jgi:ribosomal protein S18 acetylase RimI-like enzyme